MRGTAFAVTGRRRGISAPVRPPKPTLRLAVLLVLVVLGTSGCISRHILPESLSYDPALLDGTRLLGAPLPPDLVEVPSREAIFFLTPDMRTFVRNSLVRNASPDRTTRRLVRRMVAKGFFPDDYYTDETLTAQQVFDQHTGNCLSYTTLFLALARHAGLDARYQLAHLPPSWSSDGGFIVRNRHINVQVRDPAKTQSDWLTVDFNRISSSSLYPHQTVSDEFALSSFYNNMAVNHLYQQRIPETLALLRAAIEMAPYNPDAWVNVAALYSRAQQYDNAIEAFNIALETSPNNETALSGLARMHKILGHQEAAETYQNVLTRRRERNPFYHFATAQAAYEQHDFATSLESIDRAISLNRRMPHFHYLRGLIQYQLDNDREALRSLANARAGGRRLDDRKQSHAIDLMARIQNPVSSNAQGGATEATPPLPR